nr:MAG TPA: hypothetical protein [Caudoviricetes sp.]
MGRGCIFQAPPLYPFYAVCSPGASSLISSLSFL